ncbi:hypothetical protein [Brucella gallinifaecis]|uniref:hypothetical protein n=1 Tax=Brucella gallinifaecis TaxID=215590 RepID=UPI00235E8ADF|nr:hypothetical protein [Brucella gallinifaecis]
MIIIPWWLAIIFYMSMYWPVTLLVAGSIVATAFMATNSVGWRLAGSAVAILLVAPVIWFFSIA